MSTVYKPTEFQTRVLSVPADCDIALLGGRGGGKSWALGWLILQHIQTYGQRASILYVRKEWPGLRDFEKVLLELVKAAYPDATYNLKDMIWRIPNGATIEMSQCSTITQSYGKLQGRSFSMVMVDELGLYPDFSVVDTLRSNLRAPKGVATRMVIAANPNGANHSGILKRYVRKLEPWKISSLPGIAERIIHCPSTFRDNPRLNRAEYETQLRQSSAGDEGRLAAWLDGDWESGLSDLFFSSTFDETRNVVPSEDVFPAYCKPFLGADWGTSKPAYCGLFARALRPIQMGTQHIAKGSIILVDEVHTQSGDDLNSGDGSTVEEFAVPVMSMWESWGLPGRPKGVCDDGIFAKFGGRNAPSVADQFRNSGVTFNKAGKGFRRGGWELMRSMLSNAGSDKPGLYFTDLAGYALSTIPFLPRDPRRSDDVRSDGPDHAADAVRYALLGSGAVEKKKIGSYYGRTAHSRKIEGVERAVWV